MEITGMFSNMGMVSMLCFIFGLLLVVLEMFVPGFGAPGLTGTALLILGIILTARTMLEGLFLVLVILTVLGICLIIILHSATHGKLANNVILKESLKREAGFSGTEDLSSFLGKEGITHTVLRPAGTVNFDGVKLDVVSEAEYIPKGVRVCVTKVEGRRIVVREIVSI